MKLHLTGARSARSQVSAAAAAIPRPPPLLPLLNDMYCSDRDGPPAVRRSATAHFRGHWHTTAASRISPRPIRDTRVCHAASLLAAIFPKRRGPNHFTFIFLDFGMFTFLHPR